MSWIYNIGADLNKNFSLLKNGGAFLMKGKKLYAKSSYFFKNTALFGSVFNFQSKILFSLIENCVFIANSAFMGGSLSYLEQMKVMNSTVLNCIFLENKADRGGVLIISSFSDLNYLYIINNLFIKTVSELGGVNDINMYEGFLYLERNRYIKNVANSSRSVGSGSVHKILSSLINSPTIISFYNLYLNNYALSSGSIIIFSCFYKEINSIFQDNIGYAGVVVTTNQEANVNFYNCSFINELAYNAGGLFYLTDISSISMSDCNFNNISSLERGGLALIAEESQISITNSKSYNSKSSIGALFYFSNNFDIISVIKNCNFYNSSSSINIFDLFNSKIILSNITIIDCFNILFNIQLSIVEFYQIIVINHICKISKHGCLINAIEKSHININDCYFNNIFSFQNSGNIYFENSEGVILKSIFKNLFVKELKGSCFEAVDSKLNISISEFKNFSINCIYVEKNSNLSINKSIFNNSKKIEEYLYKKNQKGIIFIQSNKIIKIINTIFICSEGGINGAIAIFMDKKLDIENFFEINNNIFYLNKAKNEGGALYIYNSNITVINNIFIKNFALNGGAIYCSNDEKKITNVIFENNQFLNNLAENQGGALSWNENLPIINKINNLFKENNALYGINIAAYPIRMLLKFYLYKQTNSTINEEYLYFESSENNTILNITNISSGNEFHCKFHVFMLDYYNKLVNLNLGDVTITKLDEKNISSTKGEIIYEKTIKSGEVLFQNLKFTSIPNSISKIRFGSSSLNRYYSNFLINNSKDYEINVGGKYFLNVLIHFRKCDIGEIYIIQTNQCKECSFGEYSLIDGMIAKTCKKCPLFTDYCYRDKISIKRGFWRSSLYSDQIYFCEDFADSCLGGIEITNLLCLDGYEGPLCSICSKSYALLGDKTCQKCNRSEINIFLLCISTAFICGFLALMIYFSIKDSIKLKTILIQSQKNEKNTMKGDFTSQSFDIKKSVSIFQKILLNYFQMIEIINNMELKWPFYLKNFLGAYSGISGASGQLYILDCILYNYNIDFETLYFESLTVVLFPPFLIVITLIILKIITISNKESQTARFFSIIIIISTFFQSTIILKLFQNLNCKTIEDKKYIRVSMNIDCSSERNKNWIFIFIIPSFCYWVILYPLSFLFYILYKRRSLNSYSLISKVGFFINGYKHKFCYWEFIILLRKILFSIVTIYEGSVMAKSTFLLFLAIVSLFLTIKVKPFLMKEFNILEVYSNLSALITIYAGNIYVSNANDIIKSIAISIIFTINFSFLIRWGWSMFEITFIIYYEFFHKYFPKFSTKYIHFNSVVRKRNSSFF